MERMAISDAVAAMVLHLFLQVPRTHASELIKSKVCGADHLAFLGSSGDESLYVNGCLVERGFFCDALMFHHENGCFLEHYWYTDICGLDLPQVKLPHSGGRKLLQTHMMEGAAVVKISQLSENKGKFRTFLTSKKGKFRTLLTSKTVDVVVPGTLVLCCVMLCPCFYRKRKKMDHAALAKEPSSGNK